MVDEDHWKKQYQHLWEQTGERENFIITLIVELTGKHLERIGLGTGSSDFISGSSKMHGYEKGEADLLVKGTNVKIEVTGPMIEVPVTSDLWIRPDKTDNAMAHFPEFDTWVVHCILNKIITKTVEPEQLASALDSIENLAW